VNESLFPARYAEMEKIIERLYPLLKRGGVSEMFAGTAAALDQAEERMMKALVALYEVDGVACANLCDDDLDRSGALLGYVRDAVIEKRRAA
jgi:hypothetical protein